jgi:hypothetical protein
MRMGGGVVALLLTGCVAPAEPMAAPATTQAPRPAPAPVAIPLTPFHWTGQLSQGGLIHGQAPTGAVSVTLDGQVLPLAPDGAFLAGFDRDAGASAELVASLPDGRQVRQPLTIAPRDWRIERLNRLPKYPVPDPEFQRRRPPELALIRAARAQETDAEGWRQTLAWPVTGRISGLFGAQRVYRGEPGSYHLSRIDVRVGDHVRQGQPIGAVGATGRATGPHLHWSLQWRGRKLDPLLVTGPMP